MAELEVNDDGVHCGKCTYSKNLNSCLSPLFRDYFVKAYPQRCKDEVDWLRTESCKNAFKVKAEK
jgi:hypothetical protein